MQKKNGCPNNWNIQQTLLFRVLCRQGVIFSGFHRPPAAERTSPRSSDWTIEVGSIFFFGDPFSFHLFSIYFSFFSIFWGRLWPLKFPFIFSKKPIYFGTIQFFFGYFHLFFRFWFGSTCFSTAFLRLQNPFIFHFFSFFFDLSAVGAGRVHFCFSTSQRSVLVGPIFFRPLSGRLGLGSFFFGSQPGVEKWWLASANPLEKVQNLGPLVPARLPRDTSPSPCISCLPPVYNWNSEAGQYSGGAVWSASQPRPQTL